MKPYCKIFKEIINEVLQTKLNSDEYVYQYVNLNTFHRTLKTINGMYNAQYFNSILYSLYLNYYSKYKIRHVFRISSTRGISQIYIVCRKNKIVKTIPQSYGNGHYAFDFERIVDLRASDSEIETKLLKHIGVYCKVEKMHDVFFRHQEPPKEEISLWRKIKNWYASKL